MSVRRVQFGVRAALVIACIAAAVMLFAPFGVGVGSGPLEDVTDHYFGMFHWLIVTRSRVNGEPPATLFVINPRGAAWTVAASFALVAVFVSARRRVARLTNRCTRRAARAL